MPIGDLVRYPGNPRRGDVDGIKQSLDANGQYKPIVVQRSTMRVLAGNHTLDALGAAKAELVDVYLIDVDDERAKRIVLVDNRLGDLSTYDDDALAVLLKDLQASDEGLLGTGYDEAALAALLAGPPEPKNKGSLAGRFLAPPFSVLDARQGWWQDRKRGWLDLGIESEVGRGDSLLGFSSAAASFGYMNGKEPNEKLSVGTSVFDPVLCELVYRWFCPPNGRVIDPFAGGSVRGIVASRLELDYVGTDLRSEQIEANRDQASRICHSHVPEWIEGDARQVAKLASGKFDLMLTCPPYHDLEKYSDHVDDLSNMDWPDFCQAFGLALKGASALLKPNSFACVVIGDIRQPDGCLRNLPGITAMLAGEAGLALYNEAILVTAVGSLPIRVGRQFEAMRKLGKTHQNVLVFVKGDPKKAVARLSTPEFGEPNEETHPGAESGPQSSGGE